MIYGGVSEIISDDDETGRLREMPKRDLQPRQNLWGAQFSVGDGGVKRRILSGTIIVLPVDSLLERDGH